MASRIESAVVLGIIVPVLAALLAPMQAHANRGGITGYSENPAIGNGRTCATCHGGGGFSYAPPSLIGPVTVSASSTGNSYTFEFARSSGNAAPGAGFNLSRTAGTLLDPDTNDNAVYAEDGELTHGEPATPANDKFSWQFSYNAPSSPQTVTLYACANPVNLNGRNTLDGPKQCASFEIAVTTGPTAPGAFKDSYSVAQDMMLSVAAEAGVLANDSDANGAGLIAVLDSSPSSGELALASDGSFTYTPVAGFSGTDSFEYHANDGTNDSNVATVTLQVQASSGGGGGGALSPFLLLILALTYRKGRNRG